MDKKAQRKQAANIQRHWADMAFRDARYNQQQAKRDRTQGNITLAHLHEREARWDLLWGRRRVRLANKYSKR